MDTQEGLARPKGESMEPDDLDRPIPVVLDKSECLSCHWIGVFEGLVCPPCAAGRGGAGL